MAEISIRPARESDFAAIRRLIRAVHINPTGLHWHRFIVAEGPDGDFMGCGQVKPHRDGTRELASIAVRDAYRGRGVARAIIDHLLAHNSLPLYLMCRSALGPFYEKFDFKGLSQEDMPPYFRRMVGLAKAFELLARAGEHLLVMKRD